MTTLARHAVAAGPALGELLADLRELVECESPSSDLAAVERSADLVARLGAERLGVAPERIVVDGVHHLRWRFGADGPTGSCVLGAPRHGVAARHARAGSRSRSRDGVLRGPGCFDMIAGLVMALHAIADLGDRDGVTLLVTGDEELGSASSRALIEDEARRAAAVARARGLGRRGRAQDRPQGHVALRGRHRRPGRPRRAGAAEGGQRDPRAGPPGAGGRGAGRPRQPAPP